MVDLGPKSTECPGLPDTLLTETMAQPAYIGGIMLTVLGILLAVVGLLGLVGVLPLGVVLSIIILVVGVVLAVYPFWGPRARL